MKETRKVKPDAKLDARKQWRRRGSPDDVIRDAPRRQSAVPCRPATWPATCGQSDPGGDVATSASAWVIFKSYLKDNVQNPGYHTRITRNQKYPSDEWTNQCSRA